MEANKTQEGAVGQPRAVTRGMYKRIRLTDNEALGAYDINSENGPVVLFIATKRPDLFPVGQLLAFRNKFSAYGWRVCKHEPLEWGRTHVICKNPRKLLDLPRQR
jgi:hypothetical protein